MVRVIENLLPNEFIDAVINEKIHYGVGLQNHAGTIEQRAHTAHNHNGSSEHYVLIKKALDYLQNKTDIKVKNVERCKLNIINPMTVDSTTLDRMVHIDLDPYKDIKYNSLICYLKGVDGDTVFFDNNKKEVFRYTPVIGNGVFFSSHMWHRPTPPIKEERMVINFVLETE